MPRVLVPSVFQCTPCALLVAPALGLTRQPAPHRLPPDKVPFIVADLAGSSSRRKKLQAWYKKGGVLVIGYEMFRNLVTHGRRKPKAKAKANPFADTAGAASAPIVVDLEAEDAAEESRDDANLTVREMLLDPGPDVIICDEGHRIKNSKSNVAKALNQVRTLRRVVMTGSPLQNNLDEYWCMIDFVRPNYLGSLAEFRNQFVNPIMNGQCSDSSAADVKLMQYRVHVLHQRLQGFVQRRTHEVLRNALPPKHEYVISLRLTPVQESLYRQLLASSVTSLHSGNLFSVYTAASKICNHPDVLFKSYLEAKEFTAKEREKMRAQEQQQAQQQVALSAQQAAASGAAREASSMDQPVRTAQAQDPWPPTQGVSLEAGRQCQSGWNFQANGSRATADPASTTPEPASKEPVAVTAAASDQSGATMLTAPAMPVGAPTPANGASVSDLAGEPTTGPSAVTHPASASPVTVITPAMRAAATEAEAKRVAKAAAAQAAQAAQPWYETAVRDSKHDYTWSKEVFEAGYKPGVVEAGHKLQLFLEIAKACVLAGEKLLVFSQHLATLDLIEATLAKQMVPTASKTRAKRRPWTPRRSYYRIDGSVGGADRQTLINSFNDPKNTKTHLFLLSTRAGSLGINLVGASRVIVFDAAWNPAQDSQAVCRIFRFGQTKPCHIYRFVAAGTMEAIIYDRQVSKLGLANRVVDTENTQRRFTAEELSQLLVYKVGVASDLCRACHGRPGATLFRHASLTRRPIEPCTRTLPIAPTAGRSTVFGTVQ